MLQILKRKENRQINLVKIYIANTRENAILILFFKQYILIIFFPLSLFLQVPFPLYPLSCTFSLFKKEIACTLNKQPEKQSKMKSVLCWQLPWRVVDKPGVTPFEVTDFPFPSIYQLQIASWLQLGHCAHFFFFILGFCLARTCVGLVCAVTFSVCSCVQAPCCFWKMLGFWSHSPPLLLQPLCLLFCTDLWALRRGLWGRQGFSFFAYCPVVGRYVKTLWNYNYYKNKR